MQIARPSLCRHYNLPEVGIFAQATIVISHAERTTKTYCERAEWILFAPGPSWLGLSRKAAVAPQPFWQFRRHRRSSAEWLGRLVKSRER